MLRPKLLLLCFLLLAGFTWLYSSGLLGRARVQLFGHRPKTYKEPASHIAGLQKKAAAAATYAKAHRFNENICFLIDMGLPSGQSRFFVYDLKRDTVHNAGLVTHGRCNERWLNGRKYGNTVGCGCTSLGRYRVGYSYQGRFGLAFKLYGLDSTNSKAFDRYVVLHAHDCVPETTVADEICQSDGCPTVAPGFLQQLKPIIQASKKPVLLWIYE